MYKLLFSVILPIALQQFLITSNLLIDNLMISKIGIAATAAVGSANRFLSIISATLIGLSSANAMLTAQFNAKNDKENMFRAFSMNILLGFIAGVIFLIIYYIFGNNIVNSFSPDLEVRKIAKSFLDIAIFCTFTLNVLYALISTMRSRGIVLLPFLISMLIIVMNCFLNVVLIFGKLGFPALKEKGSAIATLSSEIFSIVIFFAFIYFLRYKLFKYASFSKEFLKKYLLIALPMSAMSFLWNFSATILHNIFGQLGKEVLAAYGMMVPVEMILINLFLGFGTAIIIESGKRLGNNEFDDAYNKAKKISILGTLIGLFLGLIVLCLKNYTFGFLSSNTITMKYLKEMVTIFAIFLPVKVFNIISFTGTFRAGGDITFLFIVGAIFSLGISVPLSIFFLHLGWNLSKIYLFLHVVDILRACCFIYRFKSRKWMKNLTK